MGDISIVSEEYAVTREFINRLVRLYPDKEVYIHQELDRWIGIPMYPSPGEDIYRKPI